MEPSILLSVNRTKTTEDMLSNAIFVRASPVFENFKFCTINDVPYVYKLNFSKIIEPDIIQIPTIHRNNSHVKEGSIVTVKPCGVYNIITSVTVEIKPYVKIKKVPIISRNKLEIFIGEKLSGLPISTNQSFVITLEDKYYKLIATHIDVVKSPLTEVLGPSLNFMVGYMDPQSKVIVDTERSSKIKIIGESNSPFKTDWINDNKQIGGLKTELNTIFRRAFSTRIANPELIRSLGILHVKGIILYGPPGTGKTLIARQIGQALSKVKPKIVSGPEILNKFVGESEKNLRELFSDAEAEYEKMKEHSDLHVIIFDEIDAICRTRGSTSGDTGVGDSMVNQLLAKMDGVDALDNILIIGMTNRLDMLDSALLRPGRFEVHLEISLPSEEGRKEIFKIHTNIMRQNGRLSSEVNISDLAHRSVNYTGAEIAGVVRSAVSFAIQDITNSADSDELDTPKLANLTIEQSHFLRGLKEVKPVFGYTADLATIYIPYGILDYGDSFKSVQSDIGKIIYQLQNSQHINVASILIQGSAGTGKTALAVNTAIESGFEQIKIIEPKDIINKTELRAVLYIQSVFDNAFKTSRSAIIIDNIEQIIRYTNIGKRFSNLIFQGIMTFIRASPTQVKDKKVIIIITAGTQTGMKAEELGLIVSRQVSLPFLSICDDLSGVLVDGGFMTRECYEELSNYYCGSISKRLLFPDQNITIQKLLVAADIAKRTTGKTITSYKDFIKVLKQVL